MDRPQATTTTAHVKLSEWLETRVEYDGVYDSAALKQECHTLTGWTPPAWAEEPLAQGLERDRTLRAADAPLRWMEDDVMVRRETRIAAKVPRDLIVTYGIHVAEAIERTFIPGRRRNAEHYIGRDRNFSAIVETLRAVGL